LNAGYFSSSLEDTSPGEENPPPAMKRKKATLSTVRLEFDL
jgi:hypothetical protein